MRDDNKDKYNREDNERRQGMLRRMRTRVNERYTTIKRKRGHRTRMQDEDRDEDDEGQQRG